MRPTSRLASTSLSGQNGARPLRVLIIDDDSFVGAAIEAMLASYDYTAVHATDVQNGLQLFKASTFDVVIVDIFMPETDGLEAIKAFRALAESIHIVAMSGFRFRDAGDARLDFLGMATSLGANCCLRKPFVPQQLMAAIDPRYDAFAYDQ